MTGEGLESLVCFAADEREECGPLWLADERGPPSPSSRSRSTRTAGATAWPCLPTEDLGLAAR